MLYIQLPTMDFLRSINQNVVKCFSMRVPIHNGVCRGPIRNTFGRKRVTSPRRVYTRTEATLWPKGKHLPTYILLKVYIALY